MAGNINKVILIGRLGIDPELKYTAQGTPVTSFRIATNESYTDTTGKRIEQTEWHRIVAWQRQAENACQFLKKGSLILVEGRLQTRKWQDQQGNDRYTTEIVAQKIIFLEPKQNGEQTRQSSYDEDYYFPKPKQNDNNTSILDEPPF